MIPERDVEQGMGNIGTPGEGEAASLLATAQTTLAARNTAAGYGSCSSCDTPVPLTSDPSHTALPEASAAQQMGAVAAECSSYIVTYVQLLAYIIYRIAGSAIYMWGMTAQAAKFERALVKTLCAESESDVGHAKCGEGVIIPVYDMTVYFAVSAILHCVYYVYRGVRACLSKCSY